MQLRNPRTKIFVLSMTGAVALIAGAFPLLKIQVFGEEFVSFVSEPLFAKIVLIFSGFILLYASFTKITSGFQRVFSVLAALVMAVFGAVPILLEYGMLPLPAGMNPDIPIVAIEGALIFYGVYMLINAYRIRKALKMLTY